MFLLFYPIFCSPQTEDDLKKQLTVHEMVLRSSRKHEEKDETMERLLNGLDQVVNSNQVDLSFTTKGHVVALLQIDAFICNDVFHGNPVALNRLGPIVQRFLEDIKTSPVAVEEFVAR